MLFCIDFLTGGVFSIYIPQDSDWERIGEGFDHDIDCGFRNGPERFLGVHELSAREKQEIIEEYAVTLSDQVLAGRLCQAALTEKPLASMIDVLKDRPAELCSWRAHLERACLVAAAEFLQENDISNEPTRSLTSDQELEPTFSVN